MTITFPRAYPEQLYDATWHVRILPRHIWAASPPSRWADDTSIAQLVGSGPYRMKAWVRGQSVTLVADTTRARVPAIRQLHWRFAADPDGALTQLLGHEADLIEHLGSPAAVERAQGDTALRLYRYPSAVYGFAAYRIGRGKASVFADRRVRQALTVAADREAIAKSIFGPGTVVLAGAAINIGAVLGPACIINTLAVVEHDCILGAGVHVSPGAALAGKVTIGEGGWIGIGACVRQCIGIGAHATVGAGGVVVAPVPEHAVVAGNPARPIRRESALLDGLDVRLA